MSESRLKVLIVDDEQIIRDGLRSFIDWEAEGFTFAGAARDAAEALEIVDRERPDLVITDISMPDCDGLELAALIRERVPATILVILSGYCEFGYAQRAIEIGVFRYLAKPVREQHLRELLSDVRRAIDRQGKGSERHDELLAQMARHRELFEDSFFAALRRGAVSEADLAEARRFLEFPPEGDLYAVAVFSIDPGSAKAGRRSPIDRQGDVLWVRTEAATACRARGIPCGAFQTSDERIALLCAFPGSSWEDAAETLQATTQDLQLKAAQELGIEFSVGVSAAATSLTTIPECCAQAERALEYHFTGGQNCVVFWWDVADRAWDRSLPTTGRGERLTQALRAGNKALAESTVDECFTAVRAMGCDDQTVYVFVAGLIHPVIGLILEMGYRLDDVLGPGSDPYRDLYRCAALSDLQVKVNQLCAAVAEFLSRRTGNAQKMLAERARRYIDDHYCDEELSLPRISRGLQASQAYVSHVFKAVHGINLSDYISRCRIEYAKQLLKKETLKMFEVAEECGFRDTNYFSTLFKRLVGVSPSEYREKAAFDIV
jgi:two-component system response regulator YesN